MMLKWRVYLALNHCEKKDQENCFAKKSRNENNAFLLFFAAVIARWFFF